MGISREQALDCFASDDLIGIGMEADAIRRQLHPEGVVSYLMDRTIDLSGFAPQEVGNDPAVGIVKQRAELDRMYEDIRQSIAMGGTGVHLQAGTPPELTMQWTEALLSSLKREFPQIWVHGLSASVIMPMATSSGLSLHDTLMRLRDAGLDSIASDDAGLLNDALRDPAAAAPCSTQDWIRVHRTAHGLGMRTTATMLFGMGETSGQRVDHLEMVRGLQEETGGFSAFIPLGFQPQGPTKTNRIAEEPTSVESLKTMAISRMYLDNIDNVQSSWETQGLKVLQMGLRFGGNDVGSVMLQTSGAKGASIRQRTTEEELRRLIRDAGFKPVQRDASYRTMFLH